MADQDLSMDVVAGGLGSHRRALLPGTWNGSFTADDTDNYDAKLPGNGKGRFTVAVDNPANQDVTCTVYGMFSEDGDVGDADVFEIASFTGSSADKAYECCNDAFPWYLIRLNYAVAPTDDPAETCNLYVHLSAF